MPLRHSMMERSWGRTPAYLLFVGPKDRQSFSALRRRQRGSDGPRYIVGRSMVLTALSLSKGFGGRADWIVYATYGHNPTAGYRPSINRM